MCGGNLRTNLIKLDQAIVKRLYQILDTILLEHCAHLHSMGPPMLDPLSRTIFFFATRMFPETYQREPTSVIDV